MNSGSQLDRQSEVARRPVAASSQAPRSVSLGNALGAARHETEVERRYNSLQGVSGERRDKVSHIETPPPEADPHELKRTLALTSLQRTARRSSARTCLVSTTAVFLACAIVAVLFANLLTRTRDKARSSRFQRKVTRSASGVRCGSEDCRRIGALLKEAMDERVRPCDDFYRHVCGRWLRSHPGKTVGQVLASAFVANVTRLARNVRIPLSLAPVHQTAVQKAARHLVACESIVTDTEDQSANVREVLAEGGIVWPDAVVENASSADVLSAMFYMSRVVRMPVLLDVVFEDEQVEQRVMFRRPDNVLALLAESKWRTQNITTNKYKKYVRAIYDSFTEQGNSSDFKKRFRNTARLEAALISTMNASVFTSEKDDVISTSTSHIPHLSLGVSKERWLTAFLKFLNTSEDFPVVISSGRYFQAVFALYNQLGEADFTELYHWLCVQVLVPFTNRRIIEAARPGDSVREKHRERCFASSDRAFHYALEYPYMSHVASAQVKNDVGQLMQRVGRSFAEVLSRTGSPILASNCSAASTERSAGAYTALFRRSRPEYFEEVYHRYPDMKLSAVANWMAVAASAPTAITSESSKFGEASPHSSVWSVPIEASYIDVPYYALAAPNAVKFAGIGSRLVGRLFSELVLNNEACRNAVMEESEETWDCIEAGLANKYRNLDVMKVDGQVAMFSWTVAWTAFRAHAASIQSTVMLEAFPGLSERALFYVVGCLLLCGDDVHQAEARCNLPLRHDQNFANAFSCGLGSPMRPKAQCPHVFSEQPKNSV